MANIQRPLKTFGTREYVSEVAAAPGNEAPILSSEVDLDLNTIYDAWNQQGSNIKPGSVVDGMLGPGSVGLSNMKPNSVDSSKIVDGSIAAADLGPGSVTTDKILDANVTKAKLEIGGSVWDIGHHHRSRDNIDIGATGGHAGYLSVPIIRTHGSTFASFLTVRVYLMGTAVVSGGPGIDVHAQLVRDGSEIVADMYGFAQGSAAGNPVPQELPWTIFYESVIGTLDTLDHNYTVNVFSLGPTVLGRLRAGNLTLIACT